MGVGGKVIGAERHDSNTLTCQDAELKNIVFPYHSTFIQLQYKLTVTQFNFHNTK